jgi:hypothetical protein
MTAGLNMMHVSKISLLPIYSRRVRKMEEKFSYLPVTYFFLYFTFTRCQVPFVYRNFFGFSVGFEFFVVTVF